MVEKETWKSIVVNFEASGAGLAIFANMILLICIYKKTNSILKPYSKILRVNCLVDLFYTCVILITFLQAECDKGDYILFMEGPFKNVPHPWNGRLLQLYVFALYFSISSYSIPFIYRYFIIVRFGFIIAFGVGKSTQWPNYDPTNGTEFEKDFDFFWRDEQGRIPIFIASHLSTPGIFIIVTGAFVGVFITYGIAGFCCVKTILHLNMLQKIKSDVNTKLQKQITFALIGQAMAPCLIGGIPLMLILVSWITPMKIPRIGIVGISGLAWTTFMNPIFAMAFISLYRHAVIDFTLKYVCCAKVNRVEPDSLLGDNTTMAC